MSSNFTVEFFYTAEYDNCVLNGLSFAQGDSSTNGGLCAYNPSEQRMYNCWSNSTTCWAGEVTCDSGRSEDQINCDMAGTTWCCNKHESCSTGTQINVCYGLFNSPHGNWSQSAMQSAEYSALGLSTLTTSGSSALTQFQSLVTTPVTPFLTSTIFLDEKGNTIAGTSVASITGPVSATSTHASTSSALQSSSSSATAAPAAHGSNRMSGGVIAGVVVGVIAISCLTIIVSLFLWQRHKRSSKMQLGTSQDHINEKEAARGHHRARAEAPHDNVRYEMSGQSRRAEIAAGDMRPEMD